MALFLSPLVVHVSAIGNDAGALVSVLALLTAGVALWRWTLRVSKKFDAFDELVSHELNHNSGTSVKDKAYEAADIAQQALQEAKRAAESADRAANGVDVLAKQFTEFLVRVSTGGPHVVRSSQDPAA